LPRRSPKHRDRIQPQRGRACWRPAAWKMGVHVSSVSASTTRKSPLSRTGRGDRRRAPCCMDPPSTPLHMSPVIHARKYAAAPPVRQGVAETATAAEPAAATSTGAACVLDIELRLPSRHFMCLPCSDIGDCGEILDCGLTMQKRWPVASHPALRGRRAAASASRRRASASRSRIMSR
jgi:hypothetical protein